VASPIQKHKNYCLQYFLQNKQYLLQKYLCKHFAVQIHQLHKYLGSSGQFNEKWLKVLYLQFSNTVHISTCWNATAHPQSIAFCQTCVGFIILLSTGKYVNKNTRFIRLLKISNFALFLINDLWK